MSRRVVMLMLRDVRSELRVDSPAEHHQPEYEPSDRTLSNPIGHSRYRRAAAFTGSCF